jgi:hypothetical protein
LIRSRYPQNAEFLFATNDYCQLPIIIAMKGPGQTFMMQANNASFRTKE